MLSAIVLIMSDNCANEEINDNVITQLPEFSSAALMECRTCELVRLAEQLNSKDGH
jgi:hypothetical protein